MWGHKVPRLAHCLQTACGLLLVAIPVMVRQFSYGYACQAAVWFVVVRFLTFSDPTVGSHLRIAAFQLPAMVSGLLLGAGMTSLCKAIAGDPHNATGLAVHCCLVPLGVIPLCAVRTASTPPTMWLAGLYMALLYGVTCVRTFRADSSAAVWTQDVGYLLLTVVTSVLATALSGLLVAPVLASRQVARGVAALLADTAAALEHAGAQTGHLNLRGNNKHTLHNDGKHMNDEQDAAVQAAQPQPGQNAAVRPAQLPIIRSQSLQSLILQHQQDAGSQQQQQDVEFQQQQQDAEPQQQQQQQQQDVLHDQGAGLDPQQQLETTQQLLGEEVAISIEEMSESDLPAGEVVQPGSEDDQASAMEAHEHTAESSRAAGSSLTDEVGATAAPLDMLPACVISDPALEQAAYMQLLHEATKPYHRSHHMPLLLIKSTVPQRGLRPLWHAVRLRPQLAAATKLLLPASMEPAVLLIIASWMDACWAGAQDLLHCLSCLCRRQAGNHSAATPQHTAVQRRTQQPWHVRPLRRQRYVFNSTQWGVLLKQLGVLLEHLAALEAVASDTNEAYNLLLSPHGTQEERTDAAAMLQAMQHALRDIADELRGLAAVTVLWTGSRRKLPEHHDTHHHRHLWLSQPYNRHLRHPEMRGSDHGLGLGTLSHSIRGSGGQHNSIPGESQPGKGKEFGKDFAQELKAGLGLGPGSGLGPAAASDSGEERAVDDGIKASQVAGSVALRAGLAALEAQSMTWHEEKLAAATLLHVRGYWAGVVVRATSGKPVHVHHTEQWRALHFSSMATLQLLAHVQRLRTHMDLVLHPGPETSPPATAWLSQLLPVFLGLPIWTFLHECVTDLVTAVRMGTPGIHSLLAKREFQAGVKYWIVQALALSAMFIALSKGPSTLLSGPPVALALASAAVMSPKVETTVTKMVVRVVGTSIGALTGWGVMRHHASATNPGVILAVLFVVACILSWFSLTQLKLATMLTLTSLSTLTLCQYCTPTCGSMGSTHVMVETLVTVVIGCVLPVLVSQLIAPWYNTEWALHRLGASYVTGAQLLLQGHQRFRQHMLQSSTCHAKHADSINHSNGAADGLESTQPSSEATSKHTDFAQGSSHSDSNPGACQAGNAVEPLHCQAQFHHCAGMPTGTAIYSNGDVSTWPVQGSNREADRVQGLGLHHTPAGKQHASSGGCQLSVVVEPAGATVLVQPAVTAAHAASKEQNTVQQLTAVADNDDSACASLALGKDVVMTAAQAPASAGPAAAAPMAVLGKGSQSAYSLGGKSNQSAAPAAAPLLALANGRQSTHSLGGKSSQNAALPSNTAPAGAGSLSSDKDAQLMSSMLGPLTDLSEAIMRDGTLWQRGVLATPPVVYELLGALTLLADRLAAMQVALTGTASMSPNFSNWMAEHIMCDVDEEMLEVVQGTLQLAQHSALLLNTPHKDPQHPACVAQLSKQLHVVMSQRAGMHVHLVKLRHAMHEKVVALASAHLPQQQQQQQLQAHHQSTPAIQSLAASDAAAAPSDKEMETKVVDALSAANTVAAVAGATAACMAPAAVNSLARTDAIPGAPAAVSTDGPEVISNDNLTDMAVIAAPGGIAAAAPQQPAAITNTTPRQSSAENSLRNHPAFDIPDPSMHSISGTPFNDVRPKEHVHENQPDMDASLVRFSTLVGRDVFHPSDTVAWLAYLYALSHVQDAAIRVARTVLESTKGRRGHAHRQADLAATSAVAWLK